MSDTEELKQDAAAAEAPAEEKPKKRGPGRPRMTPEQKAEAAAKRAAKKAAEAAAKAAAEADGAAEAPAEEKPKRKTTRKTAAAKAAEEAAATEMASAGDAAAEPPAEEKPKKRGPGRPRMTPEQKAEAAAKRAAKKEAEAAAKKAAEEAAAAAAGEAPEAAEPAEEKPKRRATRKTAAKKAEQAEDTAAADEPQDEAPAEEKPKKRGPGRPRKMAAKAGDAAADEAAKEQDAGEAQETADAPAEDKPKRRGRTRKAAAAEEADEGKDPAAAETKEGEKAPGKPDKPDKQDKADEKKSDKGDKSDDQKKDSGDDSGQEGRRRRKRNRRNGNQRREIVPSATRDELGQLADDELVAKALQLEVDPTEYGERDDLVSAVYDALLQSEGFVMIEGILDLLPDGYGFIRTDGYLPGEHDVYVGIATVRRNGLRRGDHISGRVRPPRDNEKYPALNTIVALNGEPFEGPTHRVKFAQLTPVYPDERLIMEHGKDTLTARAIDLVAPIGKGQRGLIVSPPKAGKTTVLKDVAAAISANNPEVHLMCLLVDERPEEVTDMERSINGEVISSTFDMPCENHIAVAELVIERAKRLVENGQDVVILLDSITRLARAYNMGTPASGRILSGGVDSSALYPPKRFLGAARNIEHGGSLTILGTALIDTGSKMDEVIFEEFKGTGNMELKLDRSLADKRIYPAIDPVTSGTRKEELLMNDQEAALIWGLRRLLANMNNTERAMDMLVKSLKQTETNQEFLIKSARKASKSAASAL